MRPIVAVSDLTCASDEAIRIGARLCGAGGAALHVAHCAGIGGKTLREALPLLEPAPAALRARRLDEQLLRACRPGSPVRVVAHVRYDSVSRGTLQTVADVGAGLAVVGTGPAAMAALPALVAGANVPVLVARDAAAPPFGRVLVPLGAGDLGTRTLGAACGWLRPFEEDGTSLLSDVHVLHVSGRLAEWRTLGSRIEAEVRAVEEDVRRLVGAFHRHVRWAGEAAAAIVAASRELEADLVVLRPGPGRAGEDRTWTAVVERARTNVLLLPPAAAPSTPAATGDVPEVAAETGALREPGAPDVELEPALA